MKKILLIEDNQDVCESTQEILEFANFSVITAKNGKEGVDKARRELPDIIICDIMMPSLDGYGVLRILSKDPSTSTIPFIFLTAKADRVDIRKGMNMGADDYISKPFSEMELLDAIESRLEKSENFKNSTVSHLNGLHDFMNKARGFKGLSASSKNSECRKYERKEIVYREGDFPNYLYYIVEGNVKCYRSDNYGKSFVHEVHGKGEFFGYMALIKDVKYNETCVALENTELALIPKQDFLELIYKNRDVSANLIKILSKDLEDREKQLLQLAYAPVRERLADALLKLKSKSETPDSEYFKLQISREDLANMVGAAKESLIRTLSELKKEGLLDTDGQDIYLLDEKGLEHVAIGFN